MEEQEIAAAVPCNIISTIIIIIIMQQYYNNTTEVSFIGLR